MFVYYRRLLLILISGGLFFPFLAHAVAIISPTSPFDAGLTVSTILQGKVIESHCSASKPLACTLSVKVERALKAPSPIAEKKTIKVGWMRAHDSQEFPLKNESLLLFLNRNDGHPYTAIWKAATASVYLAADPNPVVLPLSSAWAPILLKWIGSDTVQAPDLSPSDRHDNTIGVILAALAADSALTLKEVLPFLEAHPLSDEKVVPYLSLLSTTVATLPTGTQTDQRRFLRFQAHYLRHDPVRTAFTAYAEDAKHPIELRLEVATLLEQAGVGLPTAFYDTLLSSRDATIIRPTLNAIAKKRDSWSADMLFFAIRDLRSTDLQQVAVNGLMSMGKEYALPRLETAISQTSNPSLQLVLIESLGQLRTSTSVARLTPFLESDNQGLIAATVRALEKINTPEARAAVAAAKQKYGDPNLGHVELY